MDQFKKRLSIARFLTLGWIAVSFIFISYPSWAEESHQTISPALMENPPDFKIAQSQISSTLMNCQDISLGMQQLFTAALSSMQGIPLTVAACSLGSFTPQSCGADPDISNSMMFMQGAQSCANFANADSIQNQLNLMYGQFCTAECKYSAAQAIQNKVSCLQKLSSNIEAATGTFDSQFSKNVSIWKEQMTTFDAAINDDVTKLQMSTDRLQKVNDGIQKLQALTATMPAEIAGLKEAQHLQLNHATSANRSVQILQNQLIGDCLSKNTNTAYKCTPEGPTVSITDYIACKVGNQGYLGTNGRVQRDATTSQTAQRTQLSAQALLDHFISKFPTIGQFPTDPKDVTTYGNQPQLPLSVMLSQSRGLQNFSMGSGVSAYSFLASAVQYCQREAEVNVQNQQSSPMSSIGQLNSNIQIEANQVQQQYKTLLSNYQNMYVDAISAVTGQSANLALGSGCSAEKTPSAQAYANQTACLKSIENIEKNLLMGSGEQTRIKFPIAGTGTPGAKNIQVECQGLKGCAASLTTLNQKLTTLKASHEQQKISYAAKTVSMTEAYIEQAANSLKGPSTILATGMRELTTALSGMGINMNNPIKGSRAPSGVQLDQNGIPVSQSLKDDIQAKIPDYVDPQNFNNLQANVNATSSKEQQLLSTLQQAISQFRTMQVTCFQQQVQQIVSSTASNLPSASGCDDHAYCRNSGDQLIKDFQAISQLPAAGAIASLTTGIAMACTHDPGADNFKFKLAKGNLTEEEEEQLREKLSNYWMNKQMMGFASATACQQYFATLLGAAKQIEFTATNFGYKLNKAKTAR